MEVSEADADADDRDDVVTDDFDGEERRKSIGMPRLGTHGRGNAIRVAGWQFPGVLRRHAPYPPTHPTHTGPQAAMARRQAPRRASPRGG